MNTLERKLDAIISILGFKEIECPDSTKEWRAAFTKTCNRRMEWIESGRIGEFMEDLPQKEDYIKYKLVRIEE